MATLHVAFDESGKMGDSPHVVFAGFGVEGEPYRGSQFQRDWEKRLSDVGISHFHATDAFTFRGPWAQFRGNRKDRDKLILSLVELGCDYFSRGSRSLMDTDKWKALPQETRRRYRNEDLFYFAFEQGIMGMLNSSHVNQGDAFTLICDDSDEYSVECLKSYRRFIKSAPELSARVNGICFFDDKKYPPLQMADLWAYCLRREASGANRSELWHTLLERINATYSDQERQDARIK